MNRLLFFPIGRTICIYRDADLCVYEPISVYIKISPTLTLRLIRRAIFFTRLTKINLLANIRVIHLDSFPRACKNDYWNQPTQKGWKFLHWQPCPAPLTEHASQYKNFHPFHPTKHTLPRFAFYPAFHLFHQPFLLYLKSPFLIWPIL